MSELLCDGTMKEGKIKAIPPLDKKDMRLNPTLLESKKTEPQLSTPELVPKINDLTLIEKLPPSVTCTRQQKSSGATRDGEQSLDRRSRYANAITESAPMWNKWVAACRYCFNQAIAYQKKHGQVCKQKLRNIIMQSELPEWVKATPCHIRQNPIFDAHQAYSFSKNCKFRSCHAPRQTLKFNNSNYTKGKWYSRLTKGKDFQSSEPIPISSAYATRIIKTKCGDWFAVFLEEVKLKTNNVDGIIAIDPGVRTFLTGFDGQSFFEIGVGDIGKITRLCQHLDRLMSKIGKSKSKRQRQKMRKAAARSRKRIRNLIEECHHQAASWLSKNHSYILLPTFETSKMTKKKKRKIRSKTARQMLSWSHYRFKQVLKNKAELSGCQVIDVTEEFTSKTCTRCGHIHPKLGGNKLFKCPECGHEINRDFNGALGILLKALRDTSFTLYSDALVVQDDNISLCSA
ncbi:RNA-guided endonuclease InsQ/TnpB family protein [Moorena producens]|uniref:RNA-guided endonuclease InsQ/TnpB family protein n=1 Tax=Moorena producens TaxID=1155739 RepID=UPI003C70F6F4